MECKARRNRPAGAERQGRPDKRGTTDGPKARSADPALQDILRQEGFDQPGDDKPHEQPWRDIEGEIKDCLKKIHAQDLVIRRSLDIDSPCSNYRVKDHV